jgi:hypothetical protein
MWYGFRLLNILVVTNEFIFSAFEIMLGGGFRSLLEIHFRKKVYFNIHFLFHFNLCWDYDIKTNKYKF